MWVLYLCFLTSSIRARCLFFTKPNPLFTTYCRTKTRAGFGFEESHRRSTRACPFANRNSLRCRLNGARPVPSGSTRSAAVRKGVPSRRRREPRRVEWRTRRVLENLAAAEAPGAADAWRADASGAADASRAAPSSSAASSAAAALASWIARTRLSSGASSAWASSGWASSKVGHTAAGYTAALGRTIPAPRTPPREPQNSDTPPFASAPRTPRSVSPDPSSPLCSLSCLLFSCRYRFVVSTKPSPLSAQTRPRPRSRLKLPLVFYRRSPPGVSPKRASAPSRIRTRAVRVPRTTDTGLASFRNPRGGCALKPRASPCPAGRPWFARHPKPRTTAWPWKSRRLSAANPPRTQPRAGRSRAPCLSTRNRTRCLDTRPR
mmetsp:Transcript_7045/g.26621  ORF Transcript_7045/g.26621 Transcript_7045/m.26621 type:complete len:377 (-) Transcript_7045:2216-3346(-)